MIKQLNLSFVSVSVFDGPMKCNDQPDDNLYGCKSLVASWAIGYGAGECLPNDYGYRMGPNGSTSVIVQVWNSFT